MEEHKKDPPSREEPGSQEVSLGREQVEPGSKPPQSPTVAPKDVESDFITPRKRGKRRLSSDSSNSEGESLDSRTPLKMTRVGEDVMADTATTPPASPTDTIIPAATSGHDNVGKKSPQPADKPKTAPTVQKDNPAPKLRQDYPSRKAGKREQQFRSQPDGNSRRKQFQPSTRTPAFVDFPVVIHDLGGGSARFDKLGPWHRSQLLSNAVGAVRSIRPLPSGKWLIGCTTEAQQSKLARLDKLPGGTPIGARIPRPVVEGVVGPIPMGGDELKLVKQDLEAGGHRVAGVVRLNNRKQEPSLAIKISLEATELPTEVWLGATPFTVQAFAAPVRRCTKCQTLGHSKQQCRSKQTRCSKCGKGSHSHAQCDAQVFSCVNCNGRHSAAYKGCPEMQIRQSANLLRSQTYLPYNVAMQRARDELKPKAPPPAQPASAAVDNCWSRDRTAPSSLSADTGTPVSYARVAARGGTANRGPSRKNPINPRPGKSSQAAAGVPDGKHQSVAKGGHSEEVTTLLARIDQLTRWERPIISPLESNPPMTLESPDGVEDSLTADDTKGEDSPKTSKKRRRRRKKKSTKGEEKQAALQYQLVLEQQKNQALEKKIREQTTKTDGLTTELTKLVNESSVDLQQETPSFDGFLWKLMLGLIQAKLSGDCAPFLRMITALYNGMTGHEEETPTMSRSLDLLLVMSGMRDSLADGNLPESIG